MKDISVLIIVVTPLSQKKCFLKGVGSERQCPQGSQYGRVRMGEGLLIAQERKPFFSTSNLFAYGWPQPLR